MSSISPGRENHVNALIFVRHQDRLICPAQLSFSGGPSKTYGVGPARQSLTRRIHKHLDWPSGPEKPSGLPGLMTMAVQPGMNVATEFSMMAMNIRGHKFWRWPCSTGEALWFSGRLPST